MVEYISPCSKLLVNIFKNFKLTMKYPKYKSASIILTGAGVIYSGLCIYKGDEIFYNALVMPLMRMMDPENAHNLSLKMLKLGIYPRMKRTDYATLHNSVLGIPFANPLGLAAGCDKNGLAIKGFGNFNFGFIEIGSVTPLPQAGNPKPRIFRLPEDQAVINRLGFNNDGFEIVCKRLEEYRRLNNQGSPFNSVIGVNIGKNKDSESFYQDYVDGIIKFYPLADYLVINISSPNTVGLRNLQKQEFLEPLIEQLKICKQQLVNSTILAKRNDGLKFPKILLKLSPDMTTDERTDVANILLKCKETIDGVIISNTTIERPSTLKSDKALTQNVGGLSGPPLKEKSNLFIKEFYTDTNGTIPIIGVGGISSGVDAYAKIKCGASLLQLYTGLLYRGPPLIPKILKELDQLIRNDGYESIAQAVGADLKKKIVTKTVT